ncbi:hypothetical protein DICSQDRAFT_133437, partial [Dichomitus squalens LYAD-421 SS1]|uniref:uncharacterized protein n=1 Tax=Dichomitus squalens (strain LYAD-421) TaxID=732165 RepID=UPI000441168F
MHRTLTPVGVVCRRRLRGLRIGNLQARPVIMIEVSLGEEDHNENSSARKKQPWNCRHGSACCSMRSGGNSIGNITAI